MQSKQILYVEDDAANQMLIDLFFKKEPFELTMADTPEEAIGLVKSKSFDAIIVDLNLRKEGDGAELIREIREIPDYESVPIFVFSGHDAHSFKEYGIENMIHTYFSKPVSKKDLIDALRESTETKENHM